MTDLLPPVLSADDEMLRRVERSTVALADFDAGRIRAEQIERAFSSEGCGAVLIKLDERHSAMYEEFYRLQWQLGTRAFRDEADKEAATARFAALDRPVQQLLCRCGVGVARLRKGLTNPVPPSPVDARRLLRLHTPRLTGAVGRPLAGSRHEFHPSVEWLLEQEAAGSLWNDDDPSYGIVARSGEDAGVVARSRADEVRLLALYREWDSATPEAQRGHGNKYNGNIYYGAFRGRTHTDCGSTVTVLFGPGEVRDRGGRPVISTTKSRELGGTLMVASPGEETFTSLPYRLPCGSPYVVVFFEHYRERPPEQSKPAIDTDALGWAATVHGVRRIEGTGFSRGQVVVHVFIAEDDFV